MQVDAVRDVGGKAMDGKGEARQRQGLSRSMQGEAGGVQWKRERWAVQTFSQHITLLLTVGADTARKWGHKNAEFRTRLNDESGRTSGGAPTNPTQLAHALLTATLSGSLCCAHDNPTRGRGGSVLMDSGSDEQVCRPTFAPRVEPMYGGQSQNSLMCSSKLLPSQGRDCVLLELPGGLAAKTDFVVAIVGDELLSLGRLFAPMFRCSLLIEKRHDHEQGSLSLLEKELVVHVSPGMSLLRLMLRDKDRAQRP